MELEPWLIAFRIWCFIMMTIVIPVLVAAFRHRFREIQGLGVAKQWRRHGREWAILGELERSERCHANADWFELPWWAALMKKRPK